MNSSFDQTFYIKLVQFLGEALGPKYEIVYHAISKKNGAYIAAIHNNHISGRTINSPLTAFASQLIQDKVYLQKDYIYNYKASLTNKKLVTGSTFFIKNKDNHLTGLLCINYDDTEVKESLEKLIRLENLQYLFSIKKSEISLPAPPQNEVAVETLSQSIDELIENIVEMPPEEYTLTSEQKFSYISKLFNNGIFNIKGSIPSAARILRMSEPSVYRYLQKIKSESKI